MNVIGDVQGKSAIVTTTLLIRLVLCVLQLM